MITQSMGSLILVYKHQQNRDLRVTFINVKNIICLQYLPHINLTASNPQDPVGPHRVNKEHLWWMVVRQGHQCLIALWVTPSKRFLQWSSRWPSISVSVCLLYPYMESTNPRAWNFSISFLFSLKAVQVVLICFISESSVNTKTPPFFLDMKL